MQSGIMSVKRSDPPVEEQQVQWRKRKVVEEPQEDWQDIQQKYDIEYQETLEQINKQYAEKRRRLEEEMAKRQ